MTTETKKTDPKAPHGYAEDGVTPLAPYGLKADGTPRLSARGRRPKDAPQTPSALKGSGTAAKRARDQRDGLLALADAVMSPAMAATSSKGFAGKVGQRRADGIAGSLVIIDGFLPSYADWIVGLAQTKPGMLAWMDRIEDNAPYFTGLVITAQLVKAVAGQVVNPDPRLAEAARLKAAMRNAQMAEAIEQEAARMGISLVPEPEPVHESVRDFPREPRAAGVPA